MEDPYPLFRALHLDMPVYKVPGRNDYLVSRWDDVAFVAKHPNLFSSTREYLYAEDAELEVIASLGYPAIPTIVDNDDPGHAAYRSVVFRLLAPGRLASYAPRIRELADSLISQFSPTGQVEFVSAFADPFPMLVMVDLLGLPRSMAPQFRSWARDSGAVAQKYITKARRATVMRSVVDFERYLGDVITDRKLRPAQDLLSELVLSDAGTDYPLDMPQLVALTKMLLTAGTDNTTAMLASAMHLILKTSAEIERITQDNSLLSRLFEESVRVESPSQFTQRRCTADTEVGGVTIPAGGRVLLLWGAANRDESLFPDGDRFDLDRQNVKKHVAFGVGIHACIGAPLARLEGEIAFEAIFRRLKNIRLASRNDFKHIPSPNRRSLKQLNLMFDVSVRPDDQAIPAQPDRS